MGGKSLLLPPPSYPLYILLLCVGYELELEVSTLVIFDMHTGHEVESSHL